jgi:Leucine-rich repeat (LRR) protein
MKDGCWMLKNGGSTLRRICEMKTIQTNSFTNLPSNITRLDLSSNKVVTIESQAFVGCEHLQSIDLDHNQLTSLPHNAGMLSH